MLESIRRHRRILQVVLLLFIVPSFVIVGAWDLVAPGSGASTVAVVDGRKIVMPEWQEAHRRSVEAVSAQFGGQVPFSAFDTPASRVESLDELIGREVTLAATRRAHLQIPDDRLANMIAQIPQFQVDGQFNFEQARKFLEARGMTTTGFEATLRQDLLAERYPSAIGQTEIVSRRLVRRLARSETELRELWAVRFPVGPFLQTAQPSAAEVQSYFDARQADFRSEERADIALVVYSQPNSEQAESFANLVYEQSDSLEPAAQKHGLQVYTVSGLTRSGPMTPSDASLLRQPDITLALNHGPLRQALFSADALVDGRNTEAIEVRPGLLVSARVVKHYASEQLSLEQVRPRIVAELSRIKAAEASRGQADLWSSQNAAQVAQHGAMPESQLRALGLVRVLVSRENLTDLQTVLKLSSPNAQRDLARQVFSSTISQNKPIVVDLGMTEGSLVFVWRGSEVAAEDSPRVRTRIADLFNGLERITAEESWSGWLRIQEQRFKVERYPEKLAAADS